VVRAGIPPVVFCAWLENPVEIDGRMTSSYEWSEAVPIDITLGVNFGTEPPFYKTSVWAKNDDAFLYLLYRIEYPFEERQDEDRAAITYMWPEQSEDGRWPYSDAGSCFFGGEVSDTYRSIDALLIHTSLSFAASRTRVWSPATFTCLSINDPRELNVQNFLKP